MEMNARRTAPDGRLPGDQSKLNLPLGPLPILGGASSRVSCRACQARREEPPSDKRVLRRAGLFRRGRPAAGVVLGRARTVVLDDALLAPKALGAGRAVEDVDGAAVGHGPRRRQRAQQGAGQGRETHCALERGWRRGWLADGGPTTVNSGRRRREKMRRQIRLAGPLLLLPAGTAQRAARVGMLPSSSESWGVTAGVTERPARLRHSQRP